MTRDGHIAAIKELYEIQSELISDVVATGVDRPTAGTPEQRRRYVRNTIALAEGITAGMRRIALEDAKAGSGRFKTGEIAILRGRAYALTDEGRVRSYPHQQNLRGVVRFSFVVLARTYEVPFTLDVIGAGWPCLRTTVKVRNRLVHPRTPGDLVVTDAEMKDAWVAHKWFVDENLRLTTLIFESLKEGASLEGEEE